MELDGQIAIVTGAGRGIGRTIAQALAQSGMNVAIVAHRGHVYLPLQRNGIRFYL